MSTITVHHHGDTGLVASIPGVRRIARLTPAEAVAMMSDDDIRETMGAADVADVGHSSPVGSATAIHVPAPSGPQHHEREQAARQRRRGVTTLTARDPWAPTDLPLLVGTVTVWTWDGTTDNTGRPIGTPSHSILPVRRTTTDGHAMAPVTGWDERANRPRRTAGTYLPATQPSFRPVAASTIRARRHRAGEADTRTVRPTDGHCKPDCATGTHTPACRKALSRRRARAADARRDRAARAAEHEARLANLRTDGHGTGTLHLAEPAASGTGMGERDH